MSVDNMGIYLGRWGTLSGNARTVVEKHSYDGDLISSYQSLYGSGGTSTEHPRVVQLGSDGFLYVGTRSNYIHKINKETNVLIWTIRPGTFESANDIKMDNNGDLYIASSQSLYKVDPSIGVVYSGWPITFSDGDIRSIAIDSDNNIFVAAGDTVSKIDSSGNLIWDYTHTSSVIYVVVGSDGIAYYSSSDYTVNSLRLVSGEPYKTKLHTRHTSTPNALVIDKLGNLYSASSDRTILRYRPELFQSEVVIPSPDW